MRKLIFSIGIACLMALQLWAGNVEQWGVYEVALSGPANGNPFLDVTVSARFEQGTNHLTVAGFYDGDGVYRVRFSPESVGEWRYETVSSTPILNGQKGTFTVVKPSAKNHGPVRIANAYHFAYADGEPYKQVGTTCYVWQLQPEALQEQTLKTLATAPFNKIRFCVFPKRYAWNTNEPILYPFASKDALITTTNWDFTRFNVAYFQHLERRVVDLQNLGIEADIILFHPYDDGHWGFDRMPAAVDERYLRYVIARLSAYRNVWWSLANEWDFMKQKKETDFVRFGETVAANDPYHRLLSIHNGSILFNQTLPWITHASIQNGSAVEDPARAEEFRSVYRKPIVFDEVKYEGNIPRRWGNISAEELVFRFWNATVAGTYCGHGETYLSPDDVLWWSKGGVLKGQSPARLAFLKTILQESPTEGINPVDKWQSPEIGGRSPDYYLIYLGKTTPTNWFFNLPKASPDKKNLPAAGMKYKVDVLDTWAMTVTPVEDVFTLAKEKNYSFADEKGRSISLPGKPYIALRIQRVK